MPVIILNSSAARGKGAMFRKSLGEDVLVFAYPYMFPRLFHTFFCPPLRIIALDVLGRVVFDRVVARNRFVLIPSCVLVMECAPDYTGKLPSILDFPPGLFDLTGGAWRTEVPIDKLLFALLYDSVADMRRVFYAHRGGVRVKPEVLREKFELYERGQFVTSAAMILSLEEYVDTPLEATSIARSLLEIENPCLDEIVAAAEGGTPWKSSFPARCVGCGGPASWRMLVIPEGDLKAANWRYQRPENHAPVCRDCAARSRWAKEDDLRLQIGRLVWGKRFSAFFRWHTAYAQHALAEWDCREHPLWPGAFGGPTWEEGSGHISCADPLPPVLGQEQSAAIAQLLAPRRLHTPLQKVVV